MAKPKAPRLTPILVAEPVSGGGGGAPVLVGAVPLVVGAGLPVPVPTDDVTMVVGTLVVETTVDSVG
jgi:hypothetical protein